VPHCDDIVGDLEIKANDLIEIFAGEFSLEKLYYWTYEKMLNLIIIGPSYEILLDISRIFLLLTEMIGNIMNIRKLMKSLLINIEK
jgi:hypothetical protein